MEDYSQILQALLLANKAIVASVLMLFVAAAIAWRNWEALSYFILRVWHSFPLIGTIAKLSGTKASVDGNGWIDHEATLAKVYHREYKKYLRGPLSFKQAANYLSKIGESGRSARPFWVLAIVFVLVVVEAVGFGYVLGSWLNMDASDNTRLWMAGGIAVLLSIASAVFAEAAGHTMHRNKLIEGARHDFNACDTSVRDNDLVRGLQITLDDTYADDNLPAYKQQVARINDLSASVTKSYGWIAACLTLVIVVAVGSFIVRSATLESIETEMTNGYRAEMSANTDSLASPFELPEESQAVDNEANEQTIEDKMKAIRKASLTTYVMLSAIYIAIQGISIWLASIYFFGGVHSRKAYEITHKYATVDDLLDAMEQKRSAVASHADDKFRRLRDKLKAGSHNNSSLVKALDGQTSSNRSFLDYVELEGTKTNDRDNREAAAAKAQAANQAQQPLAAVAAVAAVAQVEAALIAVAPVSAPEPAPAPATVASVIEAKHFADVTGLPEESLETAARALGLTEAELRDIRAQQEILKILGAFPAKKEGVLS
jgi:hypothetical protein